MFFVCLFVFVFNAMILLGYYLAQQISFFSFISLFVASTECTLYWCFLQEYKLCYVYSFLY